MRQFLRYIKLVGERAFEKTMWWFHLVEFGLVVASLNDKVPWYAWAAVFLVDLFVSGYKVWAEEVAQHTKLEARIAAHNDRVPKFKVAITGVTKFSIQSLIAEAEKEVTQAKTTSDFFDDSAAAMQIATGESVLIPGAFGGETAQAKYERLKYYLEELRKYEKKISHLYRVGMTLASTRSDNNVEIALTSKDATKMTVDDRFVSRRVPTTEPPGQLGYGASIAALGPIGPTAQSKIYTYSYGNNAGAYSEIISLNAQRSRRVFEDELYIAVKPGVDSIELKFTLHSKKRDNPQHVTEAVDLSSVAVEELK